MNAGDYWVEQRYEDALFADCQNGHPGTGIVCHYCPIKTEGVTA